MVDLISIGRSQLAAGCFDSLGPIIVADYSKLAARGADYAGV